MGDKEFHQDLNELKTLNMQSIFLHLSTKEDLHQAKTELRSEMMAMKTDLREEMTAMKAELREEIATTKAELREEMAVIKTELKSEIGEVRNSLKWLNRLVVTTLVAVILELTKSFYPHF